MTGRRLLHRNADGEHGAVLIFAAVGMVVALLAAAMAIDVGSVIWRKRDLQVVVDLAAADTAKQLAVAPSITQALADQLGREAATRNTFDFAATGNSLTMVLGTYVVGRTPAAFAALPPADVALSDAVQVVATRKVPFTFAPGSNTVTTKAVATFAQTPRAAFSIGSKLASASLSSSTVLGPVLSGLLGVSPGLNMDLVTYNGLASSSVTLGALSAELGFATVDELLATDVTVGEIAGAAANILTAQGGVNASVISLLGDIEVGSNASLDVPVAKLFDVEVGQGDAAASTAVNVLDLLTTAGQRAQVANGANFLDIPLSVNIPNPLVPAVPSLVGTNLRLVLIQPAVISVFGPVGTQATTAQVGLNLTTNVHLELPRAPILNTNVLSLDLALPIAVKAAGGTGQITDIDCGVAPPQTPVELTVNTTAASVATGTVAAGPVPPRGTLIPQGTTLSARILVAPPVTVPVASANVSVPAATNEVLDFPGPTDPPPMTFPSAIQSVPGSPLGPTLVSDLVSNLRLDLLGLAIGPLLAPLDLVTDQIDALILNPVLDALGLSVGGADLRTLAVECPAGGAKLVQ